MREIDLKISGPDSGKTILLYAIKDLCQSAGIPVYWQDDSSAECVPDLTQLKGKLLVRISTMRTPEPEVNLESELRALLDRVDQRRRVA